MCLAAALVLPAVPAAASGPPARGADPVGMFYVDPELDPGLWGDEGGGGELANPIATGLEQGLAAWRERWAGLPALEIPAGPVLRRGDEGARVRLLRERLGLDPAGGFDRELARAVRDYRRAHGLAPGSEGDAATIASLNRGPGHYELLILANLERARALPPDPGRRYVLVDAAAMRLWLYEDGEAVDTMRVIVGKQSEQTPMLAGMIRYAMVDPYWNIPPDLVRDRVAAGVLAQGHSYLRARNYEILSGWGEDARLVSPDEVDWRAVAAGTKELRVRQLPGPGNMMGEIKFMFPNRFGVYLHDTPDKTLFGEDDRRLSSGCVRLEDARRLARWMFGRMPDRREDGRERRVDLDEPVPVYITYLTAAPSEDGIVFRDDIYDRDPALLARLESRRTRIAEGGGTRAARR